MTDQHRAYWYAGLKIDEIALFFIDMHPDTFKTVAWNNPGILVFRAPDYLTWKNALEIIGPNRKINPQSHYENFRYTP